MPWLASHVIVKGLPIWTLELSWGAIMARVLEAGVPREGCCLLGEAVSVRLADITERRLAGEKCIICG